MYKHVQPSKAFMLHILITLCYIIFLRKRTAHVLHNVSFFYIVLKTSDGSGTLHMGFFNGIQAQCPTGVPLDAPQGAFGAPLAAHLPLTCRMHEHNIT